MSQLSTAPALRARLNARSPIVVAPGVFDALSALLAEHAGFPAVFVSGSALGYSQLGRPDVNLLAITEVAAAVERIRDRISIPILVDADSGYGNALNVQRTVRMLERAGAAAIQIEDQLNHKAPDSLATRPLVSLEEMVGKIKAAQDAKACDATVVSARNDAMYTEGFDGALKRAVAYVNAGADMLFVEGLTSADQIKRVVAELGQRVPLLYNVMDGISPLQSAAEAEAHGYAVVLFPGPAIQAAATAMTAALSRLKTDGTTAGFRGQNLDGKGLNAAIGTPDLLAKAKAYSGKA